MTWTNALLSAPGWIALALILCDPLLERRFRRRHQARWGVPPRSR